MSYTRQKKLKTTLKKAIFVLLALYFIVGLVVYFFQEKIIFLPSVLEQDYTFQFKQPFEEVFLETEPHVVIHALHFKVDKPKGVILYFHGNAGDLSRWGTVAENFVTLNYDVFIIDYRTYGKSKGPINEAAFYHDAQYCYNYLKKHYLESEITIYGRSLGTGLATYLASQNKPKQIILETPYYSLTDVAKNRFPIFPVQKLMHYTFPSFQFIQNVRCPVLILHGTDDDVVPIQSAQKLYVLASKPNATFITIKGGNHNNLIEYDAYHNAIKKQLNY